jgi:hypothetical protein
MFSTLITSWEPRQIGKFRHQRCRLQASQLHLHHRRIVFIPARPQADWRRCSPSRALSRTSPAWVCRLLTCPVWNLISFLLSHGNRIRQNCRWSRVLSVWTKNRKTSQTIRTTTTQTSLSAASPSCCRRESCNCMLGANRKLLYM